MARRCEDSAVHNLSHRDGNHPGESCVDEDVSPRLIASEAIPSSSSSFEQFFADAWPWAFRLACFFTQDVAAGEDIAQDVMAKMYRTYDGSPGGEWIEMPGKYFTSPLGTAYQGDLDLRSLHIHGLKLEAFRRPEACTNPGKPLALVANYAKVEDVAGGMFGASVTLIDTATCAPAPIDRVAVSTSIDNPDVATISSDSQVPGLPVGMIRISLDLPKPGTTAIHVAVRDKATGDLNDEVAIPVIVHPPT